MRIFKQITSLLFQKKKIRLLPIAMKTTINILGVYMCKI